MALKLLIRVVKRWVAAGEDLESVLQDYPRLTNDEQETVKKAVKGD
jgi:uncharacterized protein (DUF433 family)